MKSPSGGESSWGNKSKNFSMPVKSADRLDFMKNRGVFGPEPDPRDLPQYEDKKSWGDTLEGYIRRAWAQHKPRELEVARAALREWGEEDVSPELRLPQLDLRIRNEFASRLLYAVARSRSTTMEDIKSSLGKYVRYTISHSTCTNYSNMSFFTFLNFLFIRFCHSMNWICQRCYK